MPRHRADVHENDEEDEGLEGATNHFTIIDAAKGLLNDDDWWVIKAEADPSTRPT